MGLIELTLRNFRPFKELDFKPDPEAVSVLLSPNGTGKTSVLEAVHLLATATSFRTTSASDVIKRDSDLAEVHGVAMVNSRRVSVDLTVTRNTRGATKRMLVNGQKPRSRIDLAEALPLTVFTPEGVDVVRHGPEHRRDLVTLQMTDLNPVLAETVEKYNKVLTQRNALLRSFEGSWPTNQQQEELSTWESELVFYGESLVASRDGFLQQIQPLVEDLYRNLSHDESRVNLVYERSWTGNLSDAFRSSLRSDVARGYTTIGPHRDDISLILDGRDARRQASQGEQRSLALAWRLGSHQLIKSVRNTEPLLLLDDVFSELDPLRSQRLLTFLPAGQTLVTTASPLPTGMTPALIVDLRAN